jgi:hypothetical protein
LSEMQWSPASPRVTAASLPKVLAEPGIVLIHCWASWNPSDRRMDLLLQQVRARLDPPVRFFSLDIDDQQLWPFLQEWHVMNLPALVCFVEGAFRGLFVCWSAEELEAHVRELGLRSELTPTGAPEGSGTEVSGSR